MGSSSSELAEELVGVGEQPLVLFETKRGTGRVAYRAFATSILVGIGLIWSYRVTHLPGSTKSGRWAWIGMLLSELWFGFYWILSQSLRCNLFYRSTFKHCLSHRYEKELPGVDVFVCTADPAVEPPLMVVNTVLSVMAYDYPPEKLAVYLSDDAGSRLTYYSLLEASQFSEHWLPYCRNFNVEPRSPSAYFKTIAVSPPHPNQDDSDFMEIKRLYQEMEDRIETAMKLGRIPEEVMSKHRGFSQWTTSSSQRDHDTILQIIIDGKGLDARDSEGFALPTLVYLAREKRPQYAHNFKAGAMNALIRVSSEISKGQVTLNVDCDMYSNNSQSVRDALCFLMDEEKGHEIAFVQFPQNFDNITKNELYSSSLRVLSEVEFHGLDGCGGPLYVGSGCFHRRDALSGKRFSKGDSIRLKLEKNVGSERESDVTKLEQSLKVLADCTYEEDTQWGKEMGLKYGSLVEDVITGLSIQCRGWKSVYFNPARKGFLGVAPTTLCQTLVQHKRWSEGDFQIFFSKYSPPIYGFGKLSLGLQMGYCTYCFWVPNCLATIYYSLIPSLSLVKGIQLFPQMPSPWFLVFAYVILAKYSYSLGEFIWSGGTIRGWWNDQRIWLFKRTSSYLLAFIDTILWLLGFSGSAFVITTKASDKDVSLRYEKEMMEFGTSSLMFTILTVIALTNLLCFIKTLAIGDGRRFYQTIDLQILLCGLLVLINLPLYNALFVRRDSGKMPVRLTINSIFLVLLLLFYSVFML